MKMKEIMKVLLEYKDVFDRLREYDMKASRKQNIKKKKKTSKRKS